jgi:hypothetical protein
VAPPIVPPTNNKYSPPGGSYQYNQSSNDHPKTNLLAGDGFDAPTPLASGAIQPSKQSTQTIFDPTAEPDAIQEAVRLSNEPTPLIATSYRQPVAWNASPTESDEADSEAEPEDADVPAPPVATMRAVGVKTINAAELAGAAPAGEPTHGSGSARSTSAGPAQTAIVRTQSAFREVSRPAADTSQLTVLTPDEEADASEIAEADEGVSEPREAAAQ